jgi:hypothetical protein
MRGKIDKLKRLRVVGDFLMLGTFFMLVGVFLSAYLSNDYRSTINVNYIGEAHIEMIVLLFILMPISLATVILSFIDWKQTWKARGMIMSQKQILLDESRFYQIQSGVILCPRCKMIFGIGEPNYKGLITCISCGLKGTIPSNTQDSVDDDKQGPNVRIIKDIKIESRSGDKKFIPN